MPSKASRQRNAAWFEAGMRNVGSECATAGCSRKRYSASPYCRTCKDQKCKFGRPGARRVLKRDVAHVAEQIDHWYARVKGHPAVRDGGYYYVRRLIEWPERFTPNAAAIFALKQVHIAKPDYDELLKRSVAIQMLLEDESDTLVRSREERSRQIATFILKQVSWYSVEGRDRPRRLGTVMRCLVIIIDRYLAPFLQGAAAAVRKSIAAEERAKELIHAEIPS